jgi:hypothetical protein
MSSSASRRDESRYADGVSQPEWQVACERLSAACALAGLDVVHPFSLWKYNAAVAPEWQLTPFPGDRRLGVVIGHTAALWPAFTRALREDPRLAEEEHPLERYLHLRLVSALANATSHAHFIYWAHQTEPRALPIQRLAEIVGLAALAPSHLSVHPIHGPWLALQAVAVVDMPGPLELAVLESPCVECDKPCVPALEEALRLTGPLPDKDSVAKNADAWIAVRDACPVGRGARYSNEQLRYHYTKDRGALPR